jgi:acyl-homoserine lactone acylase PvdQ
VYDHDGLTIAMRVVGLDRPKMLEQWFRMGEAQNLTQFQDALRMASVPMWNANYADSDGHILLVDNGLLPRRRSGTYEFWTNLVPGNTSRTLWTDYHSYEELPKSLDPPAGFNQNENEAPWFADKALVGGQQVSRVLRSAARIHADVAHQTVPSYVGRDATHDLRRVCREQAFDQNGGS